MKKQIISWEIAHENEAVREEMNRCETDDILDFFESDPDRLYVDGECVLFTQIGEVVIYLDGSYLVDESKIVTALTKFYNNECASVEKENEADIWYRGGMGYNYSLFELN